MTKQELQAHIDEFFSDQSRSQAQTKEALEELAEHIQMLADTLEVDDD